MTGHPSDRGNDTDKTGNKKPVNLPEADVSPHSSDNNPPAGPGALLRAAREQTNLTVPDIAAQLRLGVHIIQAIEADKYEDLPQAPAFVRGYLRGYANLLSLPPEPIIEAYDRLKIDPPNLIADITNTDEASRGAENTVRIFPYLIIGGVLLLAVLWWQNQQTEIAILPNDDLSGEEPLSATAATQDGVWMDLQDLIDDLQNAVADIVTPTPNNSVSDTIVVDIATPAPNNSVGDAIVMDIATPAPNNSVGDAIVVDIATPAPNNSIGDAIVMDIAPPAPNNSVSDAFVVNRSEPAADAATMATASEEPSVISNSDPTAASGSVSFATQSPVAATTPIPDVDKSAIEPVISVAVPDSDTIVAVIDDPSSFSSAQFPSSDDIASLTPGSPPSTTTSADSINLSLSFGAETWVEIYAGDDRNRLAYQLAQPGTRLDLQGIAPINVVFGAPENVQFWLNQQLHSVTEHTVRGVARFHILSNGEFLPGLSFQPEPGSESETLSELEPESAIPPDE